MKNEISKICPVCQGRKYVEGTCECNMEWRGNQDGNDWEDCQCVPEQPCDNCSGTGHLNTDPV